MSAPARLRLAAHVVAGVDARGCWARHISSSAAASSHDPGLLAVLAAFARPRDREEALSALGDQALAARHIDALTQAGLLLAESAAPPASDASDSAATTQTMLKAIAAAVDALSSGLAALGPDADADLRRRTGLGAVERLSSLCAGLEALRRGVDAALDRSVENQLRALDLPAHGLNLHLGSGAARAPGWLHVDVWPCELALDLRRGLPFADRSARRVYLAHVIEHFYYPNEVCALLREIGRVLEPGGRVRVVAPDIGAAIAAYVAGDRRFFAGRAETSWPDWRIETALESFLGYAGVGPSPGAFGDAHKFGYDAETLIHVLGAAGFSRAWTSTYQGSDDARMRIDDLSGYAAAAVDGRSYSLFVEAVKQ